MKWTVPKWEKKQKRLQRNSGLLLGTGVIIVAGWCFWGQKADSVHIKTKAKSSLALLCLSSSLFSLFWVFCCVVCNGNLPCEHDRCRRASKWDFYLRFALGRVLSRWVNAHSLSIWSIAAESAAGKLGIYGLDLKFGGSQRLSDVALN